MLSNKVDKSEFDKSSKINFQNQLEASNVEKTQKNELYYESEVIKTISFFIKLIK